MAYNWLYIISLRICDRDFSKLYVRNQLGSMFGNNVWLMIVYFYTKVKNRFHKKNMELFYYF